jgi:hypothetical protein
MADIPPNTAEVGINDIIDGTFIDFLSSLETTYGSFSIRKAVPSFEWGDTIAVNKRTNEQVIINDLSQIYELHFNDVVPIQEVKDLMYSYPLVLYVRGPHIGYLTTSPNDYFYANDPDYYRWCFDQIGAEGAWDITNGSSSIKVAVMDVFGGVPALHEELIGQVSIDHLDGNYGGHGISSAGAIAALTNNGEDIASLGWNLKLMLSRNFLSAPGIQQAIDDNVDVINCSIALGTQFEESEYKLVFENALAQGIVVVAATDNEVSNPVVREPAYFNFGNIGQVIAVTATMWDNENQVESFIDGYNYSPGTDPINDPNHAFIDVAAPGGRIRVLSGTSSTETATVWGTSIAAPFVSALVGLMLSVDNTLTPVEVYDIITKTADKLPQYNYDGNGWNRKIGYGRINAHNAVNVAAGAPYPPQGLSVANSAQITGSFGTYTYSAQSHLSWQANTETDFDKYRIYKATTTSSAPGLNDYILIDSTTSTSKNITITDFGDNRKIYYRITAVDTDGKESVLSESNWDWAPPSQPGGLSKSVVDGHPKISWDAKNFTDGTPRYDIYRKVPNIISLWSLLKQNHDTNYYIDTDYSSYTTGHEKDYINYKIVAKRRYDDQHFICSQFSDVINVPVNWYPQEWKKPSKDEGLPEVYAIGQNYPNPFNPTTRIKYQLPKNSFVTISIYDMLGREVAILVNEEQEAGYYEFSFDGSQLSSGTYIYKITAGDFTDSKKLLLVK